MFSIQSLNAIAKIGLDQFPKEHYVISASTASPDAILLRSAVLTEDMIPASVKVIGRAGAGVNNIPVKAMTARGIPVLNTPGANANAVRELVMTGMLLACRNIRNALHYLDEMTVSAELLDKQIEADKKQFVGTELVGKTLGVVGLGSIGVKVANAALALGMKVVGYDPLITVSRAWELSASVKQARTIDEVLQESDFITFHVPLIPATTGMIKSAQLHLLKPTAVLLNFSRDGIIDNADLMQAIQQKRLKAYVTDFPRHEFLRMPEVIALPHLGASTLEAEENCAVMVVNQLRDYLEQGCIRNAVNFPTMDVPALQTGERIAIVNANIPNMVAQISSKLGEAGLNIIELFNKSRDDIAYTLIDVETPVDAALLDAITKVKGIIQVRRIAQPV